MAAAALRVFVEEERIVGIGTLCACPASKRTMTIHPSSHPITDRGGAAAGRGAAAVAAAAAGPCEAKDEEEPVRRPAMEPNDIWRSVRACAASASSAMGDAGTALHSGEGEGDGALEDEKEEEEENEEEEEEEDNGRVCAADMAGAVWLCCGGGGVLHQGLRVQFEA